MGLRHPPPPQSALCQGLVLGILDRRYPAFLKLPGSHENVQTDKHAHPLRPIVILPRPLPGRSTSLLLLVGARLLRVAESNDYLSMLDQRHFFSSFRGVASFRPWPLAVSSDCRWVMFGMPTFSSFNEFLSENSRLPCVGYMLAPFGH